MPRNGSGSYSLPELPFTPGTTISSAAVNDDFSDIATALTGSVAADGQTPITGPLKTADGSANAPSFTFNQETSTGFYRKAAGQGAFSSLGNLSVHYDSALKWWFQGALDVVGAVNIGGTLTGVAATLTGVLTLNSTGYMVLPSGTTAQRPVSPTAATFRYNSDNTNIEFYNGSGWIQPPTANPPPASFKNLSLKVLTNTTASLVADFVTVTDGSLYQTLAFNSTLNMAASGAGGLDTGSIATSTFYSVWAIAKADGTTNVLASTSSTSPTMPSGYTYKARVGWLRSSSSVAQLLGTYQLGKRAQYIVGLAQTSQTVLIGNTTSATLAALGVGSIVPTTASVIYLYAALSAPGTFAVSPNNSTSPTNPTSNPSPMFSGNGATATGMTGSFLLESTNVYGACSAGTLYVFCLGWEDNL